MVDLLKRLQRLRGQGRRDAGQLTTGQVMQTPPSQPQLSITSIENWSLKNLLLDFTVFKGSTTGEKIYEYQKEVLGLNDDEEEPFVVMGVMDTTGNMGVMTRKCREDGHEAGYCTDHNLHLNAVKAFNGKYVCSLVAFHFN